MTSIRVLSIDVLLRNVTMRLPFRFGVHTMTVAPVCLVRLETEDAHGVRAVGW